MEKEHIKMAMLKQEQTFRQQVHELHRVYRVQKQLMMQMQVTETKNYCNIAADGQTESTVKLSRQQWCASSGDKEATLAEDFNLELTLATGTGRKQEKPSNSDSEATISSSTSAESESGRRFVPENVTTLRFQNESNRHDDKVMQSPWLYQCLSLKMA
ncbi:hypothetical protein SEVIR_3G371000v4 [Setaria viridis]|uniref:Uncharacterized protein n=1 Tax=Setaria viridis TaxID=4556 RepID=A0A4U6VHJ5_SETVI|nr:uncharacterized protein LOC117849486 [Setaria viridis]TKW29061.1 hypothetical protein SEVIR_3G371000v2 [Setaria viridis]